MREIEVKFKVLEGRATSLPMPSYATDGSAGLDIVASVRTMIPPFSGRTAVRTHLAVEIPEGYEMQIRSRSGLAVNHGVAVLNSPATIDSDYRGELMVILTNHGDAAYEVRSGDRIAQLLLAEVIRMKPTVVESLSSTGRAGGGLGHTGR